MADKWNTNTSSSSSNSSDTKPRRKFLKTRTVPGDLVPLKVEFLYDNGKISIVKIDYTNGKHEDLVGKQIDSDHPAIKRLLHIRTVVRLWYNNRLINKDGNIDHITDEEMVEKLGNFGDMDNFEEAAAALGFESGYFLTDEDGNLKTNKNGEVIPATPADVGHYETEA